MKKTVQQIKPAELGILKVLLRTSELDSFQIVRDLNLEEKRVSFLLAKLERDGYVNGCLKPVTKAGRKVFLRHFSLTEKARQQVLSQES